MKTFFSSVSSELLIHHGLWSWITHTMDSENAGFTIFARRGIGEVRSRDEEDEPEDTRGARTQPRTGRSTIISVTRDTPMSGRGWGGELGDSVLRRVLDGPTEDPTAPERRSRLCVTGILQVTPIVRVPYLFEATARSLQKWLGRGML